MVKTNNQHKFIAFVILLFVLRTISGLVSVFWESDELQVFLLGLKFYATREWPFFGPFVVYNNYQIPGALQAILTGGPLFLAPFPEASFVFLSLFSFSGLAFLCWYIEKRVTGIPRWIIWGLIMMLPWSVQFGTRIINPSYLLPFSILFFIGVFEMLPLYRDKLIASGWASMMMGFALFCAMQLQLSWILLVPFPIAVAGIMIYNHSWRWKDLWMFLLGSVCGLLFLVPTLIKYGWSAYDGAVSYLVFQTDAIQNFFTILFRFLSFPTFEVSYFLGTPADRFVEMRLYPWMTPFTFFLLGVGFLQVGFFIISFFIRRPQQEWRQVKWFSLLTFLMVFTYFLFSMKGPSSHTFYILYPVALIYSMYCYQYLFEKWPRLFRVCFIVVMISGAVYMTGLARYRYMFKSLYVNRELVQKAIDKKDYLLLGKPLKNAWIQDK